MERRAVAIRGLVQGVGFRPFVYHLASDLNLGGFVRNHPGGVQVEIEGEGASLDRFLRQLTTDPPPAARILDLSWEPQPPRGDTYFHIDVSDCAASGSVLITPDVATCQQCLAELLDPRDRRYRYPFLNCTHCGPRLTIVTAAPYDRPRTSMAGFPMCPACRREYDDPSDRRFHAQPTACPVCGPTLALLDASGHPIPCDDPVRFVAKALRQGQIVAVKGLGGYHLFCDARSAAAVAELRRRKHRDEKPFAVMPADLESAEALCVLGPLERELLASPRRPIVLALKRTPFPLAGQVAPANPRLGILLPYTPLHHLLMRQTDRTPLVATSGNRSDEPIAFQEPDAIDQLCGIADLFLTHNRPIQVRCDDSVTQVIAGVECPLRRSRGDAPCPIPLPLTCPHPILAVGGQLKATFALGRDREAILSHHLGDLDHYAAYRAFERDVELYQRLFDHHPLSIAHDLHPDYASTRYAKSLAKEGRCKSVAVQHHHAHLVSCLAENGVSEPAIGITFDGTGLGTDGAVWGGEFLVGDYRQFRRAAHLRYVGMPGGDRAVREPWRMAMAHLVDCGRPPGPLVQRLPTASLRAVRAMLEGHVNSPWTSSAGRLFDAVASLAGVRDCVSYEGQAAMQLEWLAATVEQDGTYPFELAESDGTTTIDTRPLINTVADDADQGVPAPRIARRFHSTLVQIMVQTCDKIRRTTGLGAVVLSGGVFMNSLLTTEAVAALQGAGLRVYRHRLVPPNDGGLSLGQVAIAAARLGETP